MLNVVYIHTSKRIDEELQNLCRDELCSIAGIHLAHEVIVDEDEHEAQYGWRRDPLERVRTVNAKRAAWMQHSQSALEHAIATAVSNRRVKIFHEVFQDVLDSYGTVTERSVYRHLDTLIGREQILRITFERNLSGYLRPKSPLLRDPVAMREQLLDAMQIRNVIDPEVALEQRRQRRLRRKTRSVLTATA